MLRIAITPEEILPDEAKTITAILDSGWDMVHLRHPAATVKDMRRIIEAVPQRLHRKLRLHGHFSLTDEFNLGGLHLNSRCPNPPANYSGTLSLTCHSPEQVAEAAAAGKHDYVILSPVFDSVSKQGYNAAFSPEDIRRATSCGVPVVALGGVTPARLHEIEADGFSGYAVLGYLSQAQADGRLADALAEFTKLIIKTS